MRYRSTTREVEAFRWWGEPVAGMDRVAVGRDEAGAEHYALVVPTPGGGMRAAEGDWIIADIAGIAGEAYPCRDDVFRASYEPIGNPDLDESS